MSEAVVPGAAVSEAMRGALADWRRDGLLLCLLPVFCWPAVVAAVLTRPVALVVLLSPVVLGVRELLAARWAGRALRDPAARWTSYEAVVVRRGWRPPVLVLVRPLGERAEGRRGDGQGEASVGHGGAGPGHRGRLSLGLLGRRVLPPALSARAPVPAAVPAPAPVPVPAAVPVPVPVPVPAAVPVPAPVPAAVPAPAAGVPGPGDGSVRVLLAGDPGVGGVLWVPAARRLGRARPDRSRRAETARSQPRSRVSR
ncbi:hypothetical protein ACFXKW_03440 [Streptomyces sp. NPDC059193]|uniref:hypothetical protein n=1 Tax=Streptomyces sp. NPDC059193 TaxID=3346763 RepID=UPI0036BAE975